MSTSFIRSRQSLESGGSRRPVTILLLAISLLGGWTAWAFLARVSVYKVSNAAHLEVIKAEHPVSAPVKGRVIATSLRLGRYVERGEGLGELVARTEQLQIDEQRTKQDALLEQIEVLRSDIDTQEKALVHDTQASQAALAEARANHRKAEATAEVDRVSAERYARIDADHTDDHERRVTDAEAIGSQAESDATSSAVERIAAELETRKQDRRSSIELQRTQLLKAQGESKAIAANINRLEYEIYRHTIRATVSGSIGSVNALREGSVVEEGQILGTIVPEGDLQIVADFPPAAVFGRIHTGQSARLRLDGFPWSQYGSVEGIVTCVGSAAHDGRVRVELAMVAPESNPLIPKEHGLPGTLEIEVDRVSPVTLMLRAAGRRLARPSGVRLADASHNG